MPATLRKAARKLLKLDLACGNNKQPGFVGVDRTNEGTQADVVHNLDITPWPFEDGSVGEVFCSHYVEHVDDLCAFMNELWRTLAPGGTVKFVAPYYTSVRAWQDPTHRRVISEPTFSYFDLDWRKANKLEHYPIRTNFKVEKIDHAVSEEYVGKSTEAVQYAAMHYWNVILDIVVTLRKPADAATNGKPS